MSDINQAPIAVQGSATGQTTKTSKTTSLVVGAAGAVLVLGAVGWMTLGGGHSAVGSSSTPALAAIAQSDLDGAASTLNPNAAAGLISDAKQCKVPLASMTLAKGTAPVGSTIRIRSGSYVSPNFAVTDTMQRMAIPYPGAYKDGAGVIIIEGSAAGAVVGLTPTKTMSDPSTAMTVNVVWDTDNPCGVKK